MDWRSAYLQQARSDYAMLMQLIKDEAPLCHRLHYLQMTTEKLAKGFLTRTGGPRYPNTHDAFVRFMTVAKGLPRMRTACGFTRADQYVAYVNSLMPLAGEIEALSPEGGDHPNPEYPWERAGVVLSPTEYPFNNFGFTDFKMRKMLQFIADCFSIT